LATNAGSHAAPNVSVVGWVSAPISRRDQASKVIVLTLSMCARESGTCHRADQRRMIPGAADLTTQPLHPLSPESRPASFIVALALDAMPG